VAQCQFGRNPAADRVANDNDILEVEALEERKISVYEILHAAAPVGPRLPRVPWMGRHNGSRGFRKRLGQPSDRCGARAAVQHPVRLAGSLVADG
jgi:hypothetical protein